MNNRFKLLTTESIFCLAEMAIRCQQFRFFSKETIDFFIGAPGTGHFHVFGTTKYNSFIYMEE